MAKGFSSGKDPLIQQIAARQPGGQTHLRCLPKAPRQDEIPRIFSQKNTNSSENPQPFDPANLEAIVASTLNNAHLRAQF